MKNAPTLAGPGASFRENLVVKRKASSLPDQSYPPRPNELAGIAFHFRLLSDALVERILDGHKAGSTTPVSAAELDRLYNQMTRLMLRLGAVRQVVGDASGER